MHLYEAILVAPLKHLWWIGAYTTKVVLVVVVNHKNQPHARFFFSFTLGLCYSCWLWLMVGSVFKFATYRCFGSWIREEIKMNIIIVGLRFVVFSEGSTFSLTLVLQLSNGVVWAWTTTLHVASVVDWVECGCGLWLGFQCLLHENKTKKANHDHPWCTWRVLESCWV